MGILMRGGWCTDSHGDFFTRDLVVCRSGDYVASSHGVIAAERLTDAAQEPLTLQDVKDHIGVTHSKHDAMILRDLTAARQKVEHDTGLALLTQTWRLTVQAFPPWRQGLTLPIYPIQSVDSFVSYDTDGNATALLGSPSPSPYLLTAGRPTRLALADADDWPSNLRQTSPAVLEVTAGWTEPKRIPAELLAAIRLWVAQLYSFREPMVVGQGFAVFPVLGDYEAHIRGWVLPGVA
jgi:uncharacterized phiE125 gp8 family phage protein